MATPSELTLEKHGRCYMAAEMILAPLFVHEAAGGGRRNWGVYRFAQLPAPGDRIDIMRDDGRVQCLTVMYVKHEPLREGQIEEDERYSAYVHAEWVGEFY